MDCLQKRGSGKDKTAAMVMASNNPESKRCTSARESAEISAMANKAFSKRGIDSNLKGNRLSFKRITVTVESNSKRREDCLIVPEDILSRYYMETDVIIIPYYFLKYDEEEGNYFYCYKATSPSYPSLILSKYVVVGGWDIQHFQKAWVDPSGELLVIIPENGCCTKKPFMVNLRTLAAKMLNSKGMSVHRKKDYKQSELLFSQAYSADSTFLISLFNLSCAQARLGKREDSIKSLKELISKDKKKYINKLKKDRDLDSLRNDDEFKKLLR